MAILWQLIDINHCTSCVHLKNVNFGIILRFFRWTNIHWYTICYTNPVSFHNSIPINFVQVVTNRWTGSVYRDKVTKLV